MAPEETDAQRDSTKSLGYIIDLLMDSLIDWFIDIDQSSKNPLLFIPSSVGEKLWVMFKWKLRIENICEIFTFHC